MSKEIEIQLIYIRYITCNTPIDKLHYIHTTIAAHYLTWISIQVKIFFINDAPQLVTDKKRFKSHIKQVPYSFPVLILTRFSFSIHTKNGVSCQ